MGVTIIQARRKGGRTINKAEILEFLNSNPVCHLATVEGDEPHVRGMLMYRADDTGILFHTGDFKDLYRQLRDNRNVELCFNNLGSNTQIRVCGTAEFVEDQNVKEEMVKARKFLKPWVQERGYDMLKVFRVTDCTATVWTIERNLAPKEYIKL